MVAADVDVVGGVARLDVELARRLGHLLQHPVGVEEDVVALDLLARGAEQVERLGLQELDPISLTIRRHPRSSVAIESSERIS